MNVGRELLIPNDIAQITIFNNLSWLVRVKGYDYGLGL